MWNFRKQAKRAERVQAEVVELLEHITDEIAAADAVEVLPKLRHMVKRLRYDAEMEAKQDG